MQAKLTAYAPDKPAQVSLLAVGEHAIGRHAGSAVRLDDPSVSRRHATLTVDPTVVILRDAGSRNGSFVDGAPLAASGTSLPQACWLRFGDVLCEFALLDPAQAEALQAGWSVRRAAATAHTLRLQAAADVETLLDASVRGVLELAQCERGFVLLGEPGRLQVRACVDLDPAALGSTAFRGSVGAVERALRSRASVVSNDVGSEAWLASRQSVIAAGLSTLVCLPLLDGDEAIGALYADRVRAGPPVTALDLELLEAFAERAALWVAARRATEFLRDAGAGALDWNGLAAAGARA
jgi:GAF domain-containing protein